MLARLFLLAWGVGYIVSVQAQDCSASNPCATGCCSKDGWCGIGDDYCGSGCVANCDFQSECDASRPCVNNACCSKAGFCGLGPDYCAPESCVAGCDNKAECDPGGYGKYAVHAKCPLNVCCSKWGYCGTTKEFCGDKKVTRPSAKYDKSTALKRVVGYYEGWSHERPCHSFYPEEIPPGIYTHLNYAFATIDPATFEVKLASTQEHGLIRRLASLKNQDADLKVYVALGGWAYNDPGPTQTTFSDLARSEAAQKKFFKSLISFLSTYNLDGVDIDWEYPGPHAVVDRGGRDEDFENFPVFLRRLKKALASTGGRDGVTITLPLSYWFLQHFDIVQLEKHVDFFNIMSYDLHGAWDKGNKWLGPYLNAHTNLTEINNGLDLLWRNKIASNKVVLGMAFYGRAFTATSESCLKPGCTFESAATMGSCSRENGILLNSEIIDIIEQSGSASTSNGKSNREMRGTIEKRDLAPTLDKEAAVKIVSWDNQWVAYDDEETLELKFEYSLGLGLGGAMIWAVSHDTPEQRFSNAIFNRTMERNGLTSVSVSNSTRYVEIKKTIDQCKWTNCGEMCPAGYQPVVRTDKNRNEEGELMLDSTGCKGNLHTLCCPNESMPTCGWYKHSNGFCDYTCPKDFVEVGSTKGGCHRGYQAACCRVTSNPIHFDTLSSMDLWSQCEWAGGRASEKKEPDCDAICPPLKRSPEINSTDGSGAAKCKKPALRRYCCPDRQTGNRWLDGKWYDAERLFIQFADKRDECSSDCPSDTYRLAMQRSGVCENLPGAMSYCAPNGRYDIEYKERANVTDLKAALGLFFDNPQCPNHKPGGLETRDKSVSEAHKRVSAMLSAMLGAVIFDKAVLLDYRDFWNEKCEEKHLDHLKFPGFILTIRKMFGDFYENIDAVKEAIMCYFEDLNDLGSPDPVLSCENVDMCEDEEIDCTNEEWDDPCPVKENSLMKRGAIRHYCVLPRATELRSRAYRSIGEVPSNSEIRDRAMTLRNRRDCANPQMRQVSMPTGNQINGQPAHMEHTQEMGTQAVLLGDLSLGRLDENRPNAFTPVPAEFVSDHWLNGRTMNPDVYGLPEGMTREDPAAWIPSQRIFQMYGSSTFERNFWVLEGHLNSLKNRVWRWRIHRDGPFANSTMRGHVRNINEPDQALVRLRNVMAVFEYLNHDGVRSSLRDQYRLTSHQHWLVNLAWNEQHPAQAFDIRPIMRLWFENHYEGMVRTSTAFVRRWLGEMESTWESRTGAEAERVRSDIQRLGDELADGIIHFNTDDFWDDSESEEDELERLHTVVAVGVRGVLV